MGDIIPMILVGIVVSNIARVLHPSRNEMNIYVSMFIGVIAVLVAQIGIPFGIYLKGSMLSFLLPIICISLFIFIYGQFKMPS